MTISKKKKSKMNLVYSRIDFMLDDHLLPKITEYNLISVTGAYANDVLCKIKKMEDVKNKDLYFRNEPIKSFVQSISNIYNEQKLKGILIILVKSFEVNLFEQKNIQMKLWQKGIKCKRLTLEDILKEAHLNIDNELELQGQLVSIIYYRTAFNMSHFESFSQQEAIEVKKKLVKCNALSIPELPMELINLKRMQVELSNPKIMRQYISEEQAALLEQTLVPIWNFDDMKQQQFNYLLNKLKENPKNYILKPNKEGGDNNLFGIDALNKLITLDKESRKAYILMQQIQTAFFDNICVAQGGLHFNKSIYAYQLGIYGIFGEKEQTLFQQNIGYMVRSRAKGQYEGNLDDGIDGFVPWKQREV